MTAILRLTLMITRPAPSCACNSNRPSFETSGTIPWLSACRMKELPQDGRTISREFLCSSPIDQRQWGHRAETHGGGLATERIASHIASRSREKDLKLQDYDWKLVDRALQIIEHPVNLPREKKYEGRFLIQTDQTKITAQEAVAHYKDLNELERGYRSLKDPLGMRPIWHPVERRVRAHVLVAAQEFDFASGFLAASE